MGSASHCEDGSANGATRGYHTHYTSTVYAINQSKLPDETLSAFSESLKVSAIWLRRSAFHVDQFWAVYINYVFPLN